MASATSKHVANSDDDEKNLPGYSELTSAADDQPPDYFDISIVPDGAILYRNQVMPYTERSQALVKRTKEGVLSFDSLIDGNSDQLWLYFMTYLSEKPGLMVYLNGSHTEYYTESETYQDNDGNTQTRSVDRSRSVTDFSVSVDLSPYVCEHWWRVVAIPSEGSPNGNGSVTLRTALEQYTLTRKKIKEIVLQKQVHGWNLNELRSQLTDLVRSTGYPDDITITYSNLNDRISARASSRLSQFANSTLVRVLCVLSCLVILFGPIYCCLHAAGRTKDKIVADYVLMKTPLAFIQLNAVMITNAVKSRSCNAYTAHYD